MVSQVSLLNLPWHNKVMERFIAWITLRPSQNPIEPPIEETKAAKLNFGKSVLDMETILENVMSIFDRL